uniref:Inositol oxygenase n=1 Tax=Acrobeloides nanus TaxID=290746 RepID=A0A914EE98_9BILA
MSLDVLPIGKPAEEFRKYESEPTTKLQQCVKNFYYQQHRHQTVDFVKEMKEKWLKFNHAEMPILEALDLLQQLFDESDPDLEDTPNIVHAYQTAERMRELFPDRPWLHLTGLIHDLGKVMAVWGEVQYAVVGDTYPVGCLPSETIVYGLESFKGNPDLENPKYNTKLGMYEEHCGIDKLLMSWSHDEYLYQVLINHPTCKLPEEALYAIRFHSFYPYTKSGAYRYFESEKDKEMYKWIMELNGSDLYSKSDEPPKIEELKPYYQKLIDEYVPGNVKW